MIAKKNEILTDYQAYEFSVRHLKDQRKKSAQDDGRCMYRSTNDDFVDNTLCCAVGCLITDGVYDEEIEDQSVIYDTVISALETSHPSWEMNEYSIVLLQILQSIHDLGEPQYWDVYFDILERTVFQSDDEKINNRELSDLCSAVRDTLSKDGELHPHSDIVRIGRNIIEHIEVFFSNQGIVEE